MKKHIKNYWWKRLIINSELLNNNSLIEGNKFREINLVNRNNFFNFNNGFSNEQFMQNNPYKIKIIIFYQLFILILSIYIKYKKFKKLG